MTPDKARQIADYIDSVETMMLNVWGLSGDPRRDAAMADIRSRHMQTDLRQWADEMDEVDDGMLGCDQPDHPNNFSHRCSDYVSIADYKRVVRKNLPRDPRDLLTPEEQERLNTDLQKIARLRRQEIQEVIEGLMVIKDDLS